MAILAGVRFLVKPRISDGRDAVEEEKALRTCKEFFAVAAKNPSR